MYDNLYINLSMVLVVFRCLYIKLVVRRVTLVMVDLFLALQMLDGNTARKAKLVYTTLLLALINSAAWEMVHCCVLKLEGNSSMERRNGSVQPSGGKKNVLRSEF